MAIDLTPDEFRRLGQRAVEMVAQLLEQQQTNAAPVRLPVPDDLKQRLMHDPISLQTPDELLDRVAHEVLPYPMGNASARFFAWVNSPPAPLGILAELLAAAHNASVAGGDHSATYVEHGVLNTLKTWLGYPAEAGGILVSGGSMANLVGLAAMRHVKARNNVRTDGMTAQPQRMVIYTSVQGHSCIQKAVELLGFGTENFRRIPVDADYRMNITALKAQIAIDKAAGLYPVCVAASAGTVNTGAIDPLNEIADLCEQENLWLHVDGAYGGVGALVAEITSLYAGMNRADSLAIDPHKWMYIPVECGCTFVRDKQAMRDAFSVVPPYLRDDAALPWFSEFGIQQTRSFRALKLWLVMQQVGLTGYQELIARDIHLARSLQAKIQTRPDFELVAAGSLSVTCFRYTVPNTETDLNNLNKKLAELVQREGGAFLTTTELDGRIVLRACIVNFRTTEADLEILLNLLADAGQRVLTETMVRS
jgi:aromatic-L-amino-acid/L-tryptophan decarboxylase